ncbi:MAG: 1-deoxy-D-xylulose-5-phosphate reductoisomerase [Candidatus Zapsychrus exili]|nr:1-deoxy-D-xylulose-5-phosphate reductoisomerase [Candidatus Zapsychrus exili]
MKQKNIVILGSTGSIGVNALKVIKHFKDRFKVIGLSAYNNSKLLESQVNEFNPKYVAVNEKGVKYFKGLVNLKKTKVLSAESDLEYLASLKEADIVIIGMSGSVALNPFLSAVRSGKVVAPANKEALVIAGDIIMKEAKKYNATIIPVDSEQSAIFQCLNGHNRSELKKVHLTASGGALLNTPKSEFDSLSVEKILKHPRWKMGKKITVDSATLMNKGFEVIEAKRLFDLRLEEIQVVIHPEAIMHSMVEFVDGSIIAQLGVTDMRIPIQYALTYPNRLPSSLSSVDFFKLKSFTFKEPNFNKFPCLKLALLVAKKEGTFPSVLNASDEEAVDAFLKGKLLFSSIAKIVEKVIGKHKSIETPNLKQILDADVWAREQTKKIIYG